MAGRYRAWCFRWSNPDWALTPEEVSQWPDIRAGTWQLEIGEEGTVHYQGYFEFTRAVYMGTLKTILHAAHWERRKGTQQEARDYCMKEDTRLEGPFNFGVWAAAGKRSGFNNAIDLVKAGASNETLAKEEPGMFVRYHKGFEALRLNLPQPAVVEHPRDCILFLGPTHTGKSYRLRQEFPSGPDWFWVRPGKWFDGYQGQMGLVFDEIRDSWFPWEDLLVYLDGSPVRREIKGASLMCRAHRFRLSSNVHPKFWYSGMKGKPNQPWRDSPLRSRITEIQYMEVRYEGAAAPHVDPKEPPDEYPLLADGGGVLWAQAALEELRGPRPEPIIFNNERPL